MCFISLKSYFSSFVKDDLQLLFLNTSLFILSLTKTVLNHNNSITSAIPRQWKDHFISDNNFAIESSNVDDLQHIPFLSRYIYNRRTESVYTSPTAINKWKTNFEFSEKKWQTIFRSYFASCSDSKVCYFQCRFIEF